MIFVLRAAKPQSLVDNAATWEQEYLVARQEEVLNPSVANTKKRKKNEQKYKQRDVKTALSAMFYDKCAFCERKKDYPEIEHFYPKTTFPEKCFEWENLILSCKQCNGPSNKGTKFPLADDGQPLFIHPCEGDPSEHLAFVFELDDAHPDGFIAKVKAKTQPGEATRHELQMNRLNLLKERTTYLLPYFLRLAELAKDGDEKSLDLLRKACQPQSVFAAFARSLWSDVVGRTN